MQNTGNQRQFSMDGANDRQGNRGDWRGGRGDRRYCGADWMPYKADYSVSKKEFLLGFDCMRDIATSML